nr:hypothetical protein [uncultured bacterium]
MPKIERHTIGETMDKEALILVKLTYLVRYAQQTQKVSILDDIIQRTDFVKILLRILLDLNIMPIIVYTNLLKKSEEIGKMASGFKKYIAHR